MHISVALDGHIKPSKSTKVLGAHGKDPKSIVANATEKFVLVISTVTNRHTGIEKNDMIVVQTFVLSQINLAAHSVIQAIQTSLELQSHSRSDYL